MTSQEQISRLRSAIKTIHGMWPTPELAQLLEETSVSPIEEVQLNADKERLDWLEAQGGNLCWVARHSNQGRGFRLHNVTRDDPVPLEHVKMTARGAIDAARERMK